MDKDLILSFLCLAPFFRKYLYRNAETFKSIAITYKILILFQKHEESFSAFFFATSVSWIVIPSGCTGEKFHCSAHHGSFSDVHKITFNTEAVFILLSIIQQWRNTIYPLQECKHKKVGISLFLIVDTCQMLVYFELKYGTC